ncbi:MAG TPA: MerR family transcriptional regulator [Syntrophales bacterium]|nr:MerR family transcriptional regulator [Syntrophobacterales bacterium]HRR40919.1 MerR family transcriptional regulator [Syntrophales bacterium]HRT26793.1 MerR family transcriptional regulator [Syntrophales bacterium]HRT70348.1 MerR family transcriptional regulator [Syntrophales bacterium]
MSEPLPDKNFFRIGEVSKILQVKPYVVRYWESEFKTVKPIRTSADQRLYRRQDVEELLTIKNLLYHEGFTIAGARNKLRELKRGRTEGREEDDRSRLMTIKQGLKELRKLLD